MYNATYSTAAALFFVSAGASSEKPVEFRRRPEPDYNPFAPDDVPKTAHHIEVVEVNFGVSSPLYYGISWYMVFLQALFVRLLLASSLYEVCVGLTLPPARCICRC